MLMRSSGYDYLPEGTLAAFKMSRGSFCAGCILSPWDSGSPGCCCRKVSTPWLAMACRWPLVWFHVWNSSLRSDCCSHSGLLSVSWIPCALSSPLLQCSSLSRSFWILFPLSSRQAPTYSSGFNANSSLVKLCMILSNMQGLGSPCSHPP